MAQRSVLENCYSKDIFACVLSRSGVRLFVTPWPTSVEILINEDFLLPEVLQLESDHFRTFFG